MSLSLGRYSAWCALLAFVAIGCGRSEDGGGRAPKQQPPAAPAQTASASNLQYVVLEEFSSIGTDAFSCSTVGFVDVEHAVTAEKVEHTFSAKGFACSTSWMPVVSLVLEKGARPVRALQDSKGRQVRLADGHSLLLDRANSIIEGCRRRSVGDWEERVQLIGSQYTSAKLEEQLVRFSVQERKGSDGAYLTIAFKTDTFMVGIPGHDFAVTMYLQGALALDTEGRQLYYSFVRYGGELRDKGMGSSFEGRNVVYLADREHGKAIVPDQDHFRTTSDAFAVNFVRGTGKEALPKWFPFVWGISRDSIVACAAVGEGSANPAPLVLAIAAVHAVDGFLTLGLNAGHDLASIARGEPSAKFNPFDDDEESPLNKYVYRNAARGAMEGLSWMGLVDRKNVEVYAKVGGDLLHFAGDLSSLYATPHAAWGKAAHLTGMSRGALVNLGKVLKAADLLTPTVKGMKILDVSLLMRDGFELGGAIGEELARRVKEQSSTSDEGASKAVTGAVSSQAGGRWSQTQELIKILSAALRTFENEMAVYPSGLDSLRNKGANNRPYYEGPLVDAWGRSLIYHRRLAGDGKSFSFELYSCGPNGVDDRGQGDDVTEVGTDSSKGQNAASGGARPERVTYQGIGVSWSGAPGTGGRFQRSYSEAEEKAKRILSRATAGESFESLMSEGDASATVTMTDRGVIPGPDEDSWNQVPPPLAEAVFQLPVGGVALIPPYQQNLKKMPFWFVIRRVK
jgi:hypothetical protein